MVTKEMLSEERVEELVSSILRRADEPLSTFDVFNQAYEEIRLDRGLVQRAIWNLIDSGKVAVTRDRRLAHR